MQSASNLERYKKELEELLRPGYRLLMGLAFELEDNPKEKRKYKKKDRLDFKLYYEKWYSEALEVVRQILPNRLDDFKQLYKLNKRKELNYSTYAVSDYMVGLVVKRGVEVVVDGKAAFPKFQQQLLILQSAQKRFESSLFDIRQIIQADIFDSEIDSARELLKRGFLRGAGAVAGVVLEKHLGHVCENHKIRVVKKNPGINDYNELLKKNDIIEIPPWRFIQHLGDLRNLCDHDKKREPKKTEVSELIDGVTKITKTIW